jgi:hypothetical protein
MVFLLFWLLTLSGDKQRTGTSGCNNLELVPALDFATTAMLGGWLPVEQGLPGVCRLQRWWL